MGAVYQGPPENNEQMVASLTRTGSISTTAVTKAFLNVDRGDFVDPEPGGIETRYLNNPYRNGIQHLSAPSIYSIALEALDLNEGLSFLNVCSGTGYMSALASQLLGQRAVHQAIELRAELVAHSRAKLAALGCDHVDVLQGSCLAISPSTSMHFERIYIGAGADEAMAKILFPMLEIGGVLVGPFASSDGFQRLIRVQRTNEDAFDVSELMHVQFTPLISDDASFPPPPAGGLAASNAGFAGLPPLAGSTTMPPAPTVVESRPKLAPIALSAPVWSPAGFDRFPLPHRAAVRTLLMVHAREGSALSRVPKELLIDCILPQLSYSAFRSSPGCSGACAPDDECSYDETNADGSSDASEDASEEMSRSRSLSTQSAEEEEEDAGTLPRGIERGVLRRGNRLQRLLRCL